MSSFWKWPGGCIGIPLIWSRWLGVKAFGSLKSSETVVIGRSSSMAITLQRAVCRPSSSRVCCLKTEYRIFLRIQMIRSYTPPWWEPKGGLNVHFTFFLSSVFCILSWLITASASLNSHSPLTSLVPLSEMISLTWPLQINLLRAQIQESMFKEQAISRWTALVLKQVNITPYLLTRVLPLFTSVGPK